MRFLRVLFFLISPLPILYCILSLLSDTLQSSFYPFLVSYKLLLLPLTTLCVAP